VIKLAEILGRPSDAIQMVHANRAPDTGFPAINSDRLQSFGFAPKPLLTVLQRIAGSAASGVKTA